MPMIDSDELKPLSLAVESARQVWYAAGQALNELESDNLDARKLTLLRVKAAEEFYHDMSRDLANTVRRLIHEAERDITNWP